MFNPTQLINPDFFLFDVNRTIGMYENNINEVCLFQICHNAEQLERGNIIANEENANQRANNCH